MIGALDKILIFHILVAFPQKIFFLWKLKKIKYLIPLIITWQICLKRPCENFNHGPSRFVEAICENCQRQLKNSYKYAPKLLVGSTLNFRWIFSNTYLHSIKIYANKIETKSAIEYNPSKVYCFSKSPAFATSTIYYSFN